jgi:hypothetical protein
MNHIDRLTKNYEEIKYRLLENENYRQKIYECENCAQRIETTENYLTEVETLKKKITQDALMKNKLEDEIKDLNRYIIQLQDNITLLFLKIFINFLLKRQRCTNRKNK